MTAQASPTWTTKILVKNIHCASCVSYINDLLAPYRPAIRNVDINIMNSEVCIIHTLDLSVYKICGLLDDAAFEVDWVTATDAAGKETVRIQDERRDTLLDLRRLSGYRPSFRQSRSSLACIPPPLPSKKVKHVENCDACKRGDCEDQLTRPIEKIDGDIELRSLPAASLAPRDSVRPKTQPRESRKTLRDLPALADIKEAKFPADNDEESRHKAVLSIGGMTCASCTSAVTHGLSELDYVEKVDVTLMTNSAAVIFTGASHANDLVDAVEDLGFDCSLETCDEIKETQTSGAASPNMERSSMLKIDGMFCKHCPIKITTALQTSYGEKVSIDQPLSLEDPVLHITYIPDPPRLTVRDIVSCISSVNEIFKVSTYHPPSIEERSQAMQRHESQRLLARLCLSFICAIPTFLIGVVWMSLVPKNNSVRQFFDEPVWSGDVARRDWALFFLATPVMFLAADVFHVRAFKEIRSLWRKSSRVPIVRRFLRFGSMNLLISIGTSVAYFSSIAVLGMDATVKKGSSGSNTTYFDSVVFLTMFILIGKWLEVFSKAKTGNAVAMLGNLKPSEAILVASTQSEPSTAKDTLTSIQHPLPETSRKTETIPADFLEVGDMVLVRHGGSPPSDGIVSSGHTKFNESSLTGEARSVAKIVGDKVFAGSVNVGNAIDVKVTEIGGTSMLDKIVTVVREGQTKRAPVERVVDIVTGYFVPVVTLLAIITWITWLSLGESGALSRRYTVDPGRGGWPFWSLEFAIAVFVVACPCGIGLAAPTALFVGSGLAAKHGILVQGGGEAFQEASNVDAVVFDKTGTLTEGGDLKVSNHEMLVSGDQAKISWTITKALEETSSHPLARAIFDFAAAQTSDPTVSTQSIEEVPGKGLRGTFNTSLGSYEAILGSEAFLSHLNPRPRISTSTSSTLSRWKLESKSVAVLAIHPLPTANPSKSNAPPQKPQPWTVTTLFATTDPIRPSAIPTLRALAARNIPAYLLTGDNPTTASAVARTLGIPQSNVFAGVLPTEKADKIRWLQENLGKRSSHSSPNKPSPIFPASLRELWQRLQLAPVSITHSRFASDPDPDPACLEKALPTTRPAEKKATNATIAFLGDGINDAPALAAASVSISLASASDIAITASSFILLNQSSPLTDLIALLDLSRRVFRRVKFNFAWALVYNAILVPVAAGCLFWVGGGGGGGGGGGMHGDGDGWRLGPVWGSAAMAASSLCVVGSSALLRWEGGWKVWERGFWGHIVRGKGN